MASHRPSALHTLGPFGALIVAATLQLAPIDIDHWPWPVRTMVSVILIGVIFATVFIVIHHAEEIAKSVGQLYGTLVLTFAVTTIEVSVIVSIMLNGENNPSLARESVFSTVMIVCSGVVGLCLTLGGWRHHYQDLKRQGTNAFLSVLIALTTITLVLPNYTLATGPGTFSALQLAFVSLLSVLLYGSFVFGQMARHRGDFTEEGQSLPVDGQALSVPAESTRSRRETAWNIVLLLVGLAGIVLLTEAVASGIEDGLAAFRIARPDAIIGAFIAVLVLMSEAISAIRSALNNELQRSLNIALGSACATIGLTIPAVALASLITGRGLVLGLPAGDTVLLAMALTVSILSFGTGRTTSLSGLVHLVIFVAYVLLIVTP